MDSGYDLVAKALVGKRLKVRTSQDSIYIIEAINPKEVPPTIVIRYVSGPLKGEINATSLTRAPYDEVVEEDARSEKSDLELASSH